MCARERERDAKTNTRELDVTRISLSLSLYSFLGKTKRRAKPEEVRSSHHHRSRDDQIETLGKTIKKHETYHFRVLPRRVVILLDERNHILRRDWYGT